ncbi:MAG: endonuclease III [Chitinophagaceae bacterium]|nr:endonuclease III [Chitinophagaceae bacterium]
MAAKVDWSKAIQPLLKKYGKLKHPLEYNNTYQLLVMVILSAQDSDKHINSIAPEFFKLFPDMKALAKATPAKLTAELSSVRNHRNKINWLLKIAEEIKKDSAIPLTMEELVELPGIGRKSANVIRRESGLPPEGIMVDLHTVRVAPRLGMVNTTDPKKIEEQLMKLLPQKQWDVGMCLSFHGREICRPKPFCEKCFMRDVCEYYKEVVSQ